MERSIGAITMIRDLAALRGTYRLIDKTETAILLIGKTLEMNKAGKAVFYVQAGLI